MAVLPSTCLQLARELLRRVGSRSSWRGRSRASSSMGSSTAHGPGASPRLPPWLRRSEGRWPRGAAARWPGAPRRLRPGARAFGKGGGARAARARGPGQAAGGLQPALLPVHRRFSVRRGGIFATNVERALAPLSARILCVCDDERERRACGSGSRIAWMRVDPQRQQGDAGGDGAVGGVEAFRARGWRAGRVGRRVARAEADDVLIDAAPSILASDRGRGSRSSATGR